MTQKPRAIYFLSVILALFISSSTLANEKQLLSDAIGYIQSVTADLSTKDKLNNYEQALDALSEIESISNRRSVFYWNPLTWDI